MRLRINRVSRLFKYIQEGWTFGGTVRLFGARSFGRYSVSFLIGYREFSSSICEICGYVNIQYEQKLGEKGEEEEEEDDFV